MNHALLGDGEHVVDVPPKLSARIRVYATGQGRKTEATDAHSVALVGVRITGLRPVVSDVQRAQLRVLVEMNLPGTGPQGAARLLVEVGDVTRFPTAAHFASWTGSNPSEGRNYFDRKKNAGKTSIEAIRCVKRRLSDIVYRTMLDDAVTTGVTGPGRGHRGTTTGSSATGSHPTAGSSDKPLPGPASSQPTTSLPKAGRHRREPAVRIGGAAR